MFFNGNFNVKENVFFQSASWERHCATHWREQRGWDLAIFDWFVLSMRVQIILNSSFARPGSAPIWGGKKVEFRDWTNGLRPRLWLLAKLKAKCYFKPSFWAIVLTIKLYHYKKEDLLRNKVCFSSRNIMKTRSLFNQLYWTFNQYYYTSDSLWKIWLVESIQSIHNTEFVNLTW